MNDHSYGTKSVSEQPYSLPSSTVDPPRSVRVWPGVLIVGLVAALFFGPLYVMPMTMLHFMSSMFAGTVGAVLALIWWIVGARVSGWDRWWVPILYIGLGAVLAATLYKDFIIVLMMYALPLLLAAWVGWLALSFFLPWGLRRAVLVLIFLGGWGLVAALRVDGVDGEFRPDLAWRWEPTPEEKFLAEVGNRKTGEAASATVTVGDKDWAEFRGPKRDGRLAGVKIDANWAANPPKQLWKQRIGPGWGSFAVAGDRVFTQEQRDKDEAVVCLLADTGAVAWEYKHEGRFQEPIAGAGPRATPTLANGKLYAQTATGVLLCLDAATGKALWTKDLTKEKGVEGKVPVWGYSGSPLVYKDLVFAYAGGPDNKGMAAFKADNGDLVWANGNAKHSYCSPHLATLGGVEQILLTSDYGLESFNPADGKLLWEYNWLIEGMQRVTQPTILSETDVLIGTGIGNDMGTRRLSVTKAGDKWDVKQVWSTKTMRPYFNDAVVYKGHLYGFDTARFCCIDLENGKQKWNAGNRYGNGQVLLLEDQGLLLILDAEGNVALVEATPEHHEEKASIPAIEMKTWNHPVVAQGKLFVRNGAWAACYQLQPAK